MDNDIALSRLQQLLREDNPIALKEMLQNKMKYVLDNLGSASTLQNILEHIHIVAGQKPLLLETPEALDFIFKILSTSSYGSRIKSLSGSTTKESSPLCVLVVKIFVHVYQNKPSWPLSIMEAYLDDAVNYRMWVDAKESQEFIRSLLQTWCHPHQSPTRFNINELHETVLTTFRKCLKTDKMKTSTLSLVEATAVFVSSPEIRHLLLDILDKWLMNPAYNAVMKILLENIATALQTSYCATDQPIVIQLVKAKSLFKNDDLRLVLQAMIQSNPALATVTFKAILLTEDPQFRSVKPETIKMLLTMLHSFLPSDASIILHGLFLQIFNDCKAWWSPLQARILLELFLKLIKGAAMILPVLPTLFLAIGESLEDAGLDTELTRLYLDLFSTTILNLVNDVLLIDKELASAGTTSNKPLPVPKKEPQMAPKSTKSSLFISKSSANKAAKSSELKLTAPVETGSSKAYVAPPADISRKSELLELCTHLQTALLQCLLKMYTFDIIQYGSSPVRAACCIDIINKVLGNNTVYFTKIAPENSTTVAGYLKEHGLVSLGMVFYTASLLKLSVFSWEELGTCVDLLETMVMRGIKGRVVYDGALTPEEIIGSLLSLCHALLLTPDERTTYLPPLRMHSELILGTEYPSSAVISAASQKALPAMANKTIFWRINLLTVLLACNRPDKLGEFVWSHMPSMRQLMLMVISNRFKVLPQPNEVKASPVNATDYFLFAFKQVQLLVRETGVDVLRGYSGDVEEVFERLQEEIWESVFSYGYRFRSQIPPVVAVAVPRSSDVSLDSNEDVEEEDAIEEEDEEEGEAFRSYSKKPRGGIVAEDPDEEAEFDEDVVYGEPKRAPSRGARKRRYSDMADEEDEVEESTPAQGSSVSRRGRVRKMRYDVSQAGLDDLNEEDEDYAPNVSKRGRVRRANVRYSETSGAQTTVALHTRKKKSTSVFQSELTVPGMTTQFGAIAKEELMVLCSHVARSPPESIIQQLAILNERHNLGASLRRCTDPDFISRAIIGESDGDKQKLTRSSVEKSSSWLLPTIAVDLSVLNRIPLSGAGHLLLITALRIIQRFDNVGLTRDAPVAVTVYKSCTVEQMDVMHFSAEVTAHLLHSEDLLLDTRLLFSLTQKILSLLLAFTAESMELLAVLMEDVKSPVSSHRRAFRMLLAVMATLQTENIDLLNDTSTRTTLLQAFSSTADPLEFLLRLSETSAKYKCIIRGALLEATRVETELSGIGKLFAHCKSLHASVHEVTAAVLGFCANRRALAAQYYSSEYADVTAVQNVILASLQQRSNLHTLIVFESPVSADSASYIRVPALLGLVHINVLLFCLFAASYNATPLADIITVLTAQVSRSQWSRVTPAYLRLMQSHDPIACTRYVHYFPLEILLALLIANAPSVSNEYFSALSTALESASPQLLKATFNNLGTADTALFIQLWRSRGIQCAWFNILETASTTSSIRCVPDEDMEIATSGECLSLAPEWKDLSQVSTLCTNALTNATKQGTIGIPALFSTILASESKPQRRLLADSASASCITEGFESALLEYLFCDSPPVDAEIYTDILVKLLTLPPNLLKSLMMKACATLHRSSNTTVNLLFTFCASERLFATLLTERGQWSSLISQLLEFLLEVEYSHDSSEATAIFTTLLSDTHRNNLELEFSKLLTRVLTQGYIDVYSAVLVQRLLSRKGNLKNVSYFGVTVFRKVGYKLYFRLPEVVIASISVENALYLKAFYRFIAEEVEFIIQGVGEGVISGKLGAVSPLDLIADVSPWLWDAQCEELDYSSLDAAVMMTIEDLYASAEEEFIAAAKELLLDVSRRHPLLLVRHMPTLVKRLYATLFRRKPRQEGVSKALPAAGLKPNETLLVKINMLTRDEMQRASLGSTLRKCFKLMNMKLVNRNIDDFCVKMMKGLI